MICEDVVDTYRVPQKMVTETLIHELIHAYDSCRANINWSSCLHIACTEIRAANLSGDCKLVNEINRGNFRISGQGERCIKRRAEISLRSHEHCKNIAKQAISKVFPDCVADLSPFFNR